MTGSHGAARRSPLARWVLACAVAETLGMAASAYAARTAPDLVTPAAYALVLGGGLVEGVALGLLQARQLAGRLGPRLSSRRRQAWVAVTVLLAGVGWAAGSAPTVASDSADSSQPPLALVLLGAAGIGVTMGSLLGAAQATVLRDVVRHPWRWVGASACGWPVAMVVIFAGAGTPDASWSTGSVVVTGAVTGLLAGTALGLVTGAWLPSLDGPAVSGRVVLWLLGSPLRRLLGTGLVGLRLTGSRTGRTFALPVQAAPDGQAIVVLPGHHERKRWWRNLRSASAVQVQVQVLQDGSWQAGTAEVLEPGTPAWESAREAYKRRWPRARVAPGDPIVTVHLGATPSSVTSLTGPWSRGAGDSRP